MNCIMTLLENNPAWRRAVGLAAFCLLATLPVGATEPSPDPAPAAEKPAGPGAALEPFMGTWLFEETIQQRNSEDSFQVQRYMLIRWYREHLQVKTFDYLPYYKARDMESNWKGTIAIDQWNQAKQTFTLMPDNTLSVGLSGTDGIAHLAKRNNWWAAGSIEVLTDDDAGPRLRFHTFKGFAPSATGNAWQPFDRTYHLVSREIDPKHARTAGR